MISNSVMSRKTKSNIAVHLVISSVQTSHTSLRVATLLTGVVTITNCDIGSILSPSIVAKAYKTKECDAPKSINILAYVLNTGIVPRIIEWSRARCGYARAYARPCPYLPGCRHPLPRFPLADSPQLLEVFVVLVATGGGTTAASRALISLLGQLVRLLLLVVPLLMRWPSNDL